MIENVLDASAVIAYLYDEIGAEKVEPFLEIGVIGRVNCAEVLTKLVFDGLTIDEAKATFDKLNLQVIEFDEKQMLKAADLRLHTKNMGLSLGDRCCLALAILNEATAITADRVWATFNSCKVIVVR